MQTPSEPVALVIPADSGLEPESITSLKALFEPFFIQAEDWRVKALACKVTSIEDKRGMKFARESRLALREIRISVEKRRKESKEDSLRRGKAIDGFANIFKAAVEPIEEYLLEQEEFAARESARIIAAKLTEREPLLVDYGFTLYNREVLGSMPDADFDTLLADARALHEAKQEAARKVEAERIAQEQAEAAERARVIAENARLKAEAEQAERERQAAAAKAQQALDEAAAKLKDEQERAAIESARAKAESAAELAKAQAEAAAEAARVKAEQEAESRKEALRQQALREVERQKADAERVAREKAEAELAKARAEKEAQEREEQAALDRAAAAPDKQKMAALAESIRALVVPQLTSKKGAPLVASITEAIEALAQRVENAATKL